jgi:hypothetical protein
MWAVYAELMIFCHSRAFVLRTEHEERERWLRIDRTVERNPRESYAEWRQRASPPIIELLPQSLEFVRSEDVGIDWREDRSEFHREWVKKHVADAWHYGYRPFN